MCNCCQSFFCGIATALDNLFACPNARSNNGCGCNNNSGCGCNNGYGVANAVNNLFQNSCGCGCNNNNGCGCNNNNGCGCGYDAYYAQQYALGPYSVGCNVCGY